MKIADNIARLVIGFALVVFATAGGAFWLMHYKSNLPPPPPEGFTGTGHQLTPFIFFVALAGFGMWWFLAGAWELGKLLRQKSLEKSQPKGKKD